MAIDLLPSSFPSSQRHVFFFPLPIPLPISCNARQSWKNFLRGNYLGAKTTGFPGVLKEESIGKILGKGPDGQFPEAQAGKQAAILRGK